MANKKISDLVLRSTLDTSELIELELGGHSYRTPLSNFAFRRLALTSDSSPYRIYVRGSDGDDDNDGTAYDSAHAFRTIGKAWVEAASLDYRYHGWPEILVEPTATGGIYEIGDFSDRMLGTPLGYLTLGPLINQNGNLFFRVRAYGYPDDYSDGGAPTVTIRSTLHCFIAASGMYLELFGIKLIAGAASGKCLISNSGAYIASIGIEYAGGNQAAQASGGGIDHYTPARVSGVWSTHSYETGGAGIMVAFSGGIVQNYTGWILDTPTLATDYVYDAFAMAAFGGVIWDIGYNWTGTFVGKRYHARNGGIIATGGGANYFPGTVAGTVADAASFYL